ncbi:MULTISPECIES: hypothetical protein [Mycobacterium]|uniref:DUF4386 domain-containing protein n=1 Tax=Mycobacterium paraintracellulare TaxID=1138383 RepID=A0ABN6AUM8_9MYCO|nr:MULTISPECIES: hypothetical protein [Mycobacterium]AFC54332.1 hypothetical protein OCQ_28200 [Mycobacterium paraintracellulare]OSC28660.1 hypothetical protein B8W68_07000 [Mycobacterium paraintracellulare]WSE53737.1 hypothetical protein QGN31_12305 [Mycobacterium sp. 2-64]BBY72502.1 hypothetical protein MPRI_46890 [Mycobacterium paraintracellulare]
MDLKLQRIAAWGGIAMLALFFIFFMLIAKLIPPLSPTASAAAITDFLIANKLRVRVGLALSLLAACVALPWLATICLRVRRVEGKWGVLSMTQIFAGVIFVPGFLFPMMVMAAAAFRPEERDPQITQALNDVFWLMFVGIVGTLVIQALVLTLASFLDRTEPETFPRWFGYLNAWYALLALPGGAVMIFNDGPLAWNGIFAFWVPLVAFSVWMIAVTVVLIQSISTEQSAEPVTAAAS